jgi:hypothetical protein
MADDFINMNIRSDTVIKLRATPEYAKRMLNELYQTGDIWYFFIYLTEDGDYVTSEIQRGKNFYPFNNINESVRLDVLNYCDEHNLR